MTLTDSIERIIRRNPGITSDAITGKAKCDKKAVMQAIYRIRQKNININTEFTRKDENRIAAYTIINNQQHNKKFISSNIKDGIFDDKPKLNKKEIFKSLSAQDQEMYMHFIQQSIFYDLSAKGLLESKLQTLERSEIQ